MFWILPFTQECFGRLDSGNGDRDMVVTLYMIWNKEGVLLVKGSLVLLLFISEGWVILVTSKLWVKKKIREHRPPPLFSASEACRRVSEPRSGAFLLQKTFGGMFSTIPYRMTIMLTFACVIWCRLYYRIISLNEVTPHGVSPYFSSVLHFFHRSIPYYMTEIMCALTVNYLTLIWLAPAIEGCWQFALFFFPPFSRFSEKRSTLRAVSSSCQKI